MFPESDGAGETYNKSSEVRKTVDNIDASAAAESSSAKKSTNCSHTLEESQNLALRIQRERRNVPMSSTVDMSLLEKLPDPMSPSSSTVSQATSGDDTFEPTIDMMVNDFDDEQTLNEEEALAALEEQDPQDEISTLKEEGEMPLEELLAKYRTLPPPPEPPRKKVKRLKKETHSKVDEESANEEADSIPIENTAEKQCNIAQSPVEDDSEKLEVGRKKNIQSVEGSVSSLEKLNSRRSHLQDLYPDESFSIPGEEKDNEGNLLEMYDEDNEEDDGNETEPEDMDPSYAKKTIMVGNAYQAAIPVGLSQYGDVLPYENEDKLIWEPSQVSEREVEEYLMKAREIKPTIASEIIESSEPMEGEEVSTRVTDSRENMTNAFYKEYFAITRNSTTDNRTLATMDNENVVKDDEEALHLLVQCGYDFKEALRRKRLYAVPHTGSMSLWSEEECQKFEEGVQKYGKDFLKIRQHQVRTRTMRELVQFYYLWKKSERRDHNFANSDTVDHMDTYLNENGDYNPNTASATGVQAIATNILHPALATRKMNTCTQKNFSIMTGNIVSSTATNLEMNAAPIKLSSNRKRTSTAGTGHSASDSDQ